MHIITMTKQPTGPSSDAVQQGDSAPSTIAPGSVKLGVITPEMLEAGRRVIADEWGLCGDDLAPDLARDVYLAMWAIRQRDQG